MTIPIYLLGVCISAAAWFILVKFRQEGSPCPGNLTAICLTP